MTRRILTHHELAALTPAELLELRAGTCRARKRLKRLQRLKADPYVQAMVERRTAEWLDAMAAAEGKAAA